jgi:8-oxo-dGTP diphosphatase
MVKPAKLRAPVLAAGGIVVRAGPEPLIAVVRLRKDKSWVLPKGKLKPGEDALTGARREVMEETGCNVLIEGFVGSMSHVERGKLKIVQFWRMRAEGEPAHRLTSDVTAVKWLPLQQAIDTLSRPHEKAFLVTVGQAPHQAAVPSAPGLATEHTRPVPEYNGLPKSNRFFESIRVWLRRLIS